MKWFRVYHEMPHDPKLRRIAHQAGATLPHTLAVWLFMLCHASQNEGDARGTLAGWSDDDCAFALGMDRAVVFAIRQQMEGKTLDGPRIMAWSKRQAQSDNATSRWRQWNEKRRAESEENQNPDPKPTLGKRGSNVGQTSKKRREESRREEDTPHTPRTRGAAPAAPRVDLPAWLPLSAWADWCAYRKGKTWTQRAAELSIKNLDDLREQGHDPERVIQQSIANGWRGLFPLKASASPTTGKLDWVDNHPLFQRPA